MNITLPETPWNPQPPVEVPHTGGITEVFKVREVRLKSESKHEKIGDGFDQHNEDSLREAMIRLGKSQCISVESTPVTEGEPVYVRYHKAIMATAVIGRPFRRSDVCGEDICERKLSMYMTRMARAEDPKLIRLERGLYQINPDYKPMEVSDD